MKRIIEILCFMLIPAALSGQITPVTNQYVLNPLTINPAYAGKRGALNLAAFYRKQWVGINGAPETMTLTIDSPLPDTKLGLGLIVTNDKIGVTKKTSFSTNYAFVIRMGEGNLSLGIGAGVFITNTNWSDLSVEDPGDDYYLSNQRAFVIPDFSFGVYYSARRYFIGISIPRLLSHKFDYNKDKYTLQFTPDKYYYLINTGYIFTLAPKLKFSPSTLMTYSQGEKLLYDLNGYFIFNDRLWLGGSYRNSRSVAGLLQFAINNQLKVAYTYDFDFSELRRFSNGSHEIMLRYEFRYKVNVVNPLVF